MSETPIFQSTEQALQVLFLLQARLGALVLWVIIAVLHLLGLTLLLTAAWTFQVTPGHVQAAAQQLLQTWPLATLSAAGLSGMSVLAGYWWLVRWVHQRGGRDLLMRYLMKGL